MKADRGLPDRSRAHAFFETDAYAEGNPVIPIRAQLVAQMLSGLRGARVLDLGCGDGSVSRPLLEAGNDVTLVDFSNEMLRRAQARELRTGSGKARYVEADVLEWEPDAPYDVVLCIGVLAHIESPSRLLGRVATATRPGGTAIVQITDLGRILGRLVTYYSRWRRREGYRLNEFTRATLVALARGHGLLPSGERSYGFLLPGTGHLPYRWHLWLEERFASGLPAKIGTDVLLSFERTNSR
jgi:SAM-dependent methyltransferase